MPTQCKTSPFKGFKACNKCIPYFIKLTVLNTGFTEKGERGEENGLLTIYDRESSCHREEHGNECCYLIYIF